MMQNCKKINFESIINNRGDMARFWKLIGVAMMLIVMCRGTQAACTINSKFPAGSYNFNIGMLPPINITPDMKIGDVIFTRQWSLPEWGQADLSTYAAVQCDPGAIESFGGTTEYDPINEAYKLPNIEGIEFQISYPANPTAQGAQVVDLLAPVMISNAKSPGFLVYPPASQGRPLILRLIVTGDIKAGEAPVQKYVSGGVKSPIFLETISLTFGVKIQVPTCTLLSSNINVQMPNTSVSEFSGIGSTGKRKPFELRMICNAVKTLSIEFDSQYARSGTPGTIDLSNQDQGAASGIGIRMRYGDGDVPVPIGQKLDITASSLDSGSLPMSAEYIQTGGTVKAGVANSIATFTIEYQ
jgi:type 1 fimbria pilin